MNVTSLKLTAPVPIYDGTPSTGFGPPDVNNFPREIDIAEFFTKKPARSQSYILKGVTGLDLDGITARPFAGPLVTDQVSSIFVPFPGPRTIVMLIELNPNYSLGETSSVLRDNLYKAIGYSAIGLVNLNLMDGSTAVATCTGSIQKFESSLFNSDSEVQITITCDYPFLRQNDLVSVDLDAALYDPDASNPVYVWYDNLSTAPHGVIFTFATPDAVGDLDTGVIQGFTFTYADPALAVGGQQETQYLFTMTGAFYDNRPIELSTEFDDKYIRIPQFGISEFPPTNIADYVSLTSVWPIMMPGVNTLRFFSGVGGMNLTGIFYRPAYWGV